MDIKAPITTTIYIISGVLPSLAWLYYYLRKDLHPEPKKMIIKVFLWGALATLPVIYIQLALKSILDAANVNPLAHNLLYWFLIIGFSEEFFKYLVIRINVINSPHLDEPLDIMLYMVVAALGFAAVENVFYLLSTINQISLGMSLEIYFIRFIGAVFLHTLCSAVIGYALAVSFCEARMKKTILVGGILAAAILHGTFDFSMVILPKPGNVIVSAFVVLTLAFLVFSGFDNLKKKKGICKLN